MKTTDDFFIPDNEVKLPEELDYSRVSEYIRSAEAFSRSTYQSVYIIEFPVCVAKSHVPVRIDTSADDETGLPFLSGICAGR